MVGACLNGPAGRGVGTPHGCPCASTPGRNRSAPEGLCCAQDDLLDTKREKMLSPLPGHRMGKATKYVPSFRDISRDLCFQFNVQIKGGGYFRKQMVMIRVLSLK